MPADVSTSLPQLDLAEGTVVTVTADDPGAVIGQLVVHGWQELPGAPADEPLPLLTLEPLEES